MKNTNAFRRIAAINGVLTESGPKIENTDEEESKVGVDISKRTEWDGASILRICAHALEDANFHAEATTLRKMAAKYD